MSTGMRAERAQARASRVTGHASASMMRVGMEGPVSRGSFGLFEDYGAWAWLATDGPGIDPLASVDILKWLLADYIEA